MSVDFFESNKEKSSNIDDTSQQPFLYVDGSIHRERQQSFTSKFYGVTESHQYEQDENEVWKHHQIQR
jgi:hypothetical protein